MTYSGYYYYQGTLDESFSSEIELVDGNRLLYSRQYDDAIKIYQTLLEKDGNDPNILCRMGFCYYFKGDLDRSYQLFETALLIDENHYLSHKWMGNALIKTNNPIEARVHLDRAIPIVTKELLPIIINGKKSGGVYWEWLSIDEKTQPIKKEQINSF